MSTFHKGELYRVREAFPAYVLTMWTAPCTGGDEKLLPAGLEFTVTSDPNEGASALHADAAPQWEQILVDRKDRWAFQYAGYYLVVPFAQVEKHCQRIS